MLYTPLYDDGGVPGRVRSSGRLFPGRSFGEGDDPASPLRGPEVNIPRAGSCIVKPSRIHRRSSARRIAVFPREVSVGTSGSVVRMDSVSPFRGRLIGACPDDRRRALRCARPGPRVAPLRRPARCCASASIASISERSSLPTRSVNSGASLRWTRWGFMAAVACRAARGACS
ncbi:hypothetical protein Mapa_017616 [Marchantia paleacea]|nr:hypothetical protein Mapa_017616 [Marchantia paleacea]